MSSEDWYVKFEEQKRAERRAYVIKTAGYSFVFGQLVGTSGYVLQTGKLGPAGLGAGAFMGVCMSVGFALRSWE